MIETDKVIFSVLFISLSICEQDISKSTLEISVTCDGKLGRGLFLFGSPHFGLSLLLYIHFMPRFLDANFPQI